MAETVKSFYNDKVKQVRAFTIHHDCNEQQHPPIIQR